MKTKISKIFRPQALILLASLFSVIQYQNCAKPVNQSAESSAPSYVATPLQGSTLNSSVSSNNSSQNGQMLFAESSIELTSESDVLRPGGICSQSQGSQIEWQLVENAVNAQVGMQGSEACEQGSFYVNLSSQIGNLECEKSYSLLASLSGQGSTTLSIIKHCPAVASN